MKNKNLLIGIIGTILGIGVITSSFIMLNMKNSSIDNKVKDMDAKSEELSKEKNNKDTNSEEEVEKPEEEEKKEEEKDENKPKSEDLIPPDGSVDKDTPVSNNNTSNSNNNDKPIENNPVEKTFTATFNKNGATSIGSNSLSCKTTGSSCTVTAPSITRSGYTVVGWSTSSAGGSEIKVGNNLTLTKHITYYAITKAESYYIDADGMLSLINTERSKVSAKNLTLSSILTANAKIRAEEICRVFSHNRPDGSLYDTILNKSGLTTWGENIAAGSSTISATFNQWMDSPGHKANMLNGSFGNIGIAGYYCSTGQYKYYWVQLFSN